jgi:hypothetical protein
VNNIAEQNGEACKRLSESLRQWRSTQSKVKIEKQTIDEITKKNLESLGYM